MPLSSVSLFHYTNKGMVALKGILSEGFKVSYSFEYSPNFYVHKTGSHYISKPSSFTEPVNPNLFYLYIPMVSFCDIPISNSKLHLKNYGCPDETGKKIGYAIGLSKRWGVAKGLNQVLYTIPGSSVAQTISSRCRTNSDFYKENNEMREKIGTYGVEKYAPPITMTVKDGLISDNKNNLFPFEVLYLKPIGESKKDGPNDQITENSFIDEKEWRYVPNNACIISGRRFFYGSHHSDYYRSMHENAEKAKNQAPEYDKLKFEADDITHIVVGRDSEIPEIIDHLNAIYGSTVPHNKLMLLYSKVTSYETLERDFFSH